MSSKNLIRTLSLSPRYGVDSKPQLEEVSPTLEKKPSLGLISPRMLNINSKSKSQSFYKPKKLPPLNFKILIGGDDNTGKTSLVLNFLISETLQSIKSNTNKESLIKIEVELDLEEGITIFNSQPSKGIDYLISAGLIEDSEKGIIKFLNSNLKSLSPLQVGKFIGRKSNENLLEIFMSNLNFQKMEFLNAFRYLLGLITLPKENKDGMERILKEFSKTYFSQNEKEINEIYNSSDALFILSKHILYLNQQINQNNIQISKKLFIDSVLNDDMFKSNLKNISSPRSKVGSGVGNGVGNVGTGSGIGSGVGTGIGGLSPRKSPRSFKTSFRKSSFRKLDLNEMNESNLNSDLEGVYDELIEEPIEEIKLLKLKETKECYTKRVKLKKREININLLDSLVPAGQNEFSSLESTSIREGDGFILLYDITNEESFNNIQNYYKKIQRCKGEDSIIFLVGNKIDQNEQRKISFKQGSELANKLQIPFFETTIDSIPIDLLPLQIELEKISKGDDFYMVKKDDKQVLEVSDVFMKLIWAMEFLHHDENVSDKKCFLM